MCLLGFIYQYSVKISKLSEKVNLKKLKTKLIVHGSVTNVTNVMKSSRKTIFYEFKYSGKLYSNNISDVFNYSCRVEFDNLKFPILIDSINPETNFILFHKRDYKYFGYPTPDSMASFFNCIQPSGSYIFSPAPISPD